MVSIPFIYSFLRHVSEIPMISNFNFRLSSKISSSDKLQGILWIMYVYCCQSIIRVPVMIENSWLLSNIKLYLVLKIQN